MHTAVILTNNSDITNTASLGNIYYGDMIGVTPEITVTPINTSDFLAPKVEYEYTPDNRTYVDGYTASYNTGYNFINQFGNVPNYLLHPTSTFDPDTDTFTDSVGTPYRNTFGRVPITPQSGTMKVDSLRVNNIGPSYDRFISDDSSSDDVLRTSLDMTLMRPTLAFYRDYNDDPKARKMIVNLYHYKFLDKWLKEDYSDLFDYFDIVDGRVNLRKPTEHKKKLNEQEIENITDYIEKFFLTKSVTKRQLERIIKEAMINWIKLPQNESIIKKTLYHKLKSLLRRAIQ